jgi:hypothetical protein
MEGGMRFVVIMALPIIAILIAAVFETIKTHPVGDGDAAVEYRRHVLCDMTTPDGRVFINWRCMKDGVLPDRKPDPE